MEPDLRVQAARALAGEPFPGFAIGGLSVGEPRDLTDRLVALTAAELPEDRPRYLMGVGEPDQLLAYAAAGVDLFDCVLPTRLGRTGHAYTSGGQAERESGRACGPSAGRSIRPATASPARGTAGRTSTTCSGPASRWGRGC